MASAKVVNQEIDLSTRVPSFPGVYGALVVAAKKGPVGIPQLMTSDTAFLQTYTPDETVKVGYDSAYFSGINFLSKSNKMWVVRAANSSLYAALSLKTYTSAYLNHSISDGLADPTAYVFDSGNDVEAAAQVSVVTAQADVAGSLNNKYFLLSSKTVNYYVWYNVNAAGVDPAPAGKTGIPVAIATGATAAQVASATQAAIAGLSGIFTASVSGAVVTINNVVLGVALTATADFNTGWVIAVTTAGADTVNVVDESILIFAANQGQWGKQVGIKVITYTANPGLVKEPGAFVIQVYKTSNLQVPVETWTCSRVQGAKDGFGRNIYVEDVLEGSEYIRAINNPAVADTVLPKDQSTLLLMDGGDDGDAVTDSDLIDALQPLRNKDEIPLTIIMDGGNASPAFQLEIDDICQSRQDCVGIFSVPYVNEAASSYMTQILQYRNTDLNLDSSYSAIYTPHLKIFDRFNNRNLYVAPDGFAAAAISATASNYEIWFPAAGFTRGKITALETRRKFSEGERDALYDAQINPIRFTAGRGIAIWGQKTLQVRPSSLQNLNVRLLLLVIEPAISEALEEFLFEINDSTTRLIAKTRIDRYMENIQSRRGVFDFSTVINETNNTDADVNANRMNVDLYVIPVGSVEEIVFRTIITSFGVSLSQS